MREMRRHRTLRYHAEVCVRSLRVGLLARGFRGSFEPSSPPPVLPQAQPSSSGKVEGGFPHTVAGPHRLLTGFPVMPSRAPEATNRFFEQQIYRCPQPMSNSIRVATADIKPQPPRVACDPNDNLLRRGELEPSVSSVRPTITNSAAQSQISRSITPDAPL